ncbi:MAG: hypothetical protein AAB664_03530 [Patescibacteria group bacterium]
MDISFGGRMRRNIPTQKKNTAHSQKKTWWIGGAICVIVLSLWGISKQKHFPNIQPPLVTPKPVTLELSLMKKHGSESLTELLLRLRKTYPIKKIRDELEVLSAKIDNGKIKLRLDADKMLQKAFALSYLDETKIPIIAFSTSGFQQIREDNKDLPQLADDELIAILLHEHCHVMKHKLLTLNEINAKKIQLHEIIEGERECWWYTVKELYYPMLQAGRLNGYFTDGVTGLALKAYNQSNGDMYSPAWTRYAIRTTGAPESILKKNGITIP